jgi:hypothetical protein
MDHEFQSGLVVFDRVRKDGQPPPRVNAINIITHANTQFQWIANGGWLIKDDFARKTRVRWLSIAFRLDYWKVQHTNMGIPLVNC